MMPSTRLPPDWAWVLLAAAVRIAFALTLGDRFHQIDEIGYDTPAWQLATAGVLGSGGSAQVVPPVPNAFFALFYALFGHDKLYPRLGQALAGALVAWLVGRMTRDMTGSKLAGRLALALSAVYPFFVYYSGMVMSETLYLVFCLSGLWWLCLCLAERGSVAWRPPAAGAALGLAALCRTEAAPITAVLWGFCAVACLLRRCTWRAWVLAVFCWALPLVGWALRNQAATGAFTLDTHGGITLLHGTLLFDQNEVDTSKAMDSLKEMPFYRQAQSLPEAERDRIYRTKAFSFMLENPGATLRQWGRKLVNFWRFYPRTDKPYHETIHSHPGAGLPTSALVVISLLFEPWIILGGLWGLWELRQRAGTLFPLGLFVLGTMGVHMVSVSQMRYRLPVMPVLILGVSFLAARRLEQGSGT